MMNPSTKCHSNMDHFDMNIPEPYILKIDSSGLLFLMIEEIFCLTNPMKLTWLKTFQMFCLEHRQHQE